MENVLLRLILCVLIGHSYLLAFPMLPELDSAEIDHVKLNDSNGTAHNFYVIRTIVYEVGILTEADNDTESDESYEEVGFTFFDQKHNSTALDLSNIPFPIQTNISRTTITSIAPGPIGIFSLQPLDENGTEPFADTSVQLPIVPGYVIKEITNVRSTSDPDEQKEIIENLSTGFGI